MKTVDRAAVYAAVIVALAVLLAACGSDSHKRSITSSTSSTSSSNGGATAPGVTATSVTFGTAQPLSGPAASGYSEIAPASHAYFDYVNAHGGVYGRQIHLIIKDDSYDPTNTVTVVHQLALQDNVFGIFEGLGTATQTKVTGFLNASRVPDVFVASACPCWADGTAQPYTFGSGPSSTIEGKILGRYIRRRFPGQKVGVLYQDDEFGQGGLAGIEDELPASDVVSKQGYQYGTTSLTSQVASIALARAKVMVDFTLPIYTAIAQLTAVKLDYKPQLVLSGAGSDPTTVAALLKTLSKGAESAALIDGAITDDYLPSASDTSNRWIRLFMKIRAEYDPSAPFDGNVVYGMANAYSLVQALEAAGKNLTRQGLINAMNEDGASWMGPGLVPYSYSSTDHGGYSGAEIGTLINGKIVLSGGPLTTTAAASSPITPYTGTQPAPPASGMPSN